jgi:putative restriction endonuclease
MGFDPSALEVGAHYTRPQLAELWGYASHVAIARGVVTPAGGGYIILFVTREKQRSSTQYNDYLNGDSLHWEGEERHGSDIRIARAHEHGEEVHLFYRDIHHTPFTYFGQVLPTRYRSRNDRPSEFIFQLTHDLGPDDDIARKHDELARLSSTEREAVVKARVGQGRFREDLLHVWRGCAITDVRRPDLLRASHIKPWRWSSNPERLDPHNGLLLLPHYDHLFDRGYITFDDSGTLVPSPAIKKLPPSRLGIDASARLRRIKPEHLVFMEYHFENVFLRHVSAG